MDKNNYNNILKLFIVTIIIYGLLKIINIDNKDLILIIIIDLIAFYLLQTKLQL